MSTYLKKFYLDDRKLAQRALLEFHRALKSGRVIAFTGAMTTEGFGYPDWDGLIKTIRGEAKSHIECSDTTCPTCAELDCEKHLESFKPHFKAEARVGLSLIGELADKFDKSHQGKMPRSVNKTIYRSRNDKDSSRRERLELGVARIARHPENDVCSKVDVPRSLWKNIGIQRFATLNYDLELEKLLMLTSEEQAQIGENAKDKDGKAIGYKVTTFQTLEDLRDLENGTLDWSENSSRIKRILPNGRTVESDMVSRDRSDRLIDFAMGSDEAEQHILHLHGRCDDQASLIVSYRDYDRLYRRDDLHRQPFEYGHRIMTGGNPILFVGLGMKEAEINRTLENFISNTPYHRTAPTFLLWSSSFLEVANGKKKSKRMDADQLAAFRMDKLHRLGVFTIFDSDVLKLADQSGLTKLVESKREPLLKNLQLLTEKVCAAAKTIGERESYVGGKNWRNMEAKVHSAAKPGQVAKLWGVDFMGQTVDAHIAKDRRKLLKKLDENHAPLFAMASAGWGKGQLGSTISKTLSRRRDKPYVLHANAGFCFDTDSFLDTIARFMECVAGVQTEADENKPWNYSHSHVARDAYFSRINLCGIEAKLPANAYCIINGIDRFLDVHGLPLSAEFDRFIEQLMEDSQKDDGVGCNTSKHIRWLFLGSDRTRLYLERKSKAMDERRCWLAKESIQTGTSIDKTKTAAPYRTEDLIPENNSIAGTDIKLASAYLQAIKTAMSKFTPQPADIGSISATNDQARDRSGEARRLSIEKLRRAFLDAYLETEAFQACGLTALEANLAMEILRALAFIGLPVEEKVLRHVPRIFRCLDKNKNRILSESELKTLSTVLANLSKWQLIVKIEGFEENGGGPPPIRYGLHRAIMSELRFRLGLPLSEAKLSTAFNMSLYVAQPVDGYIPEPEIHDELGDLIDSLVGAYKDQVEEVGNHINPKAKKHFSEHAFSDNPPFGFVPIKNMRVEKKKIVQLFHKRCEGEYVSCLRAALAVVRGYYSTTGLLTLDRNDRLISEDRDGILLEHAERLDDLIDAYGKTAKMRDDLRDVMNKDFVGTYGNSEPFYADELVWLHNERGVVRLAMGDLFEADRSFQTALSVNKGHVEYGDRSHNWRRIKLNQLTVEIEGAELTHAERMIREVLEASGWPVDERTNSIEKAEEIFRRCHERKSQNRECETENSKHYFLQEDRLAIAVALGYRGMCANLRGEMLDAIDDLQLATQLLRRLDEQRAFSYFTRLFAWGLHEIGKREESDAQMDLANDAAQSTRQMDLVYRTEIMRAQWRWEREGSTVEDRQMAARAINNALEYGIAADMQRVRTEAASSLAKLKLNTGDHEVALQYTAEAMTIATRYNLKLRMMSVRVRLGEIMIRRGDIKTGRALIMGAIKSASRSGFQRVVDSGQQAMDKLN